MCWGFCCSHKLIIPIFSLRTTLLFRKSIVDGVLEINPENQLDETTEGFSKRVGSELFIKLGQSIAQGTVSEEQRDVVRKFYMERFFFLLSDLPFLERKGENLVIRQEGITNHDIREFGRRLSLFEGAVLEEEQNLFVHNPGVKKGRGFIMNQRNKKSWSPITDRGFRVCDKSGNEYSLESLFKGDISNLEEICTDEIAENLMRQEVSALRKLVRIHMDHPGDYFPIEEKTARMRAQNSDDGFLAMRIEEDGEEVKYRRITLEELKKLLRTENLDPIFDNPKPGRVIRRSDVAEDISFAPKRLSIKKGYGPEACFDTLENATKPIDGVRYISPESMIDPKTGEEVRFGIGKCSYVKMSPDYTVLIQKLPGKSVVLNYYLLKHLSKSEASALCKEEGGVLVLPAEETAKQIMDYDPALFVPRLADEGEEEYKERTDSLWNFTHFLSIYRELIDTADFRLQQFLLRQQLYFAAYYARLSKEKKGYIQKYLKKYGEKFFIAFISLEQGGNGMGDIILDLARGLGDYSPKIKELSERVFQKFSELFESSNRTVEAMQTYFSGYSDQDIVQTAQEDIIREGINILKKAQKALLFDSDSEQKKMKKIRRIIKEIEYLDGEIQAMGKVFRQLVSQYHIDLSEVDCLALEDLGQDQMQDELNTHSKRLKVEMLKTYDKNYALDDPEFAQILKDGFEAKIGPGVRFDILYFDPKNPKNPEKKRKNMIAFLRFTDHEEEKGKRYLGAVNIDPKFKGFKILEPFMRQSLDREFQNTDTIILHTVPGSTAESLYERDYGFKITKEEVKYKQRKNGTWIVLNEMRLDRESYLRGLNEAV